MTRQGIVLILLILGSSALGKCWHWAKDGFSLGRTHFPLERAGVISPDSEVISALKQPYRYIGRGHQFYAFESEDGRYVFKLPRYDRYTLPFWLRACPFSFLDGKRKALREDKQQRLRFLLGSIRIAFEDLPNETALLYSHFAKTDLFHGEAILFDRIGRQYRIDLDRSAFILQRKKPLMMPAFVQSLESGDRESAKKILSAFLRVVEARARKGIYNKDPSFLRNFGYDGEGIQIDIGSFYRKDEGSFAPSFLQTVGHVKEWLNGVDPEIADWFMEQTEKIAKQ